MTLVFLVKEVLYLSAAIAVAVLYAVSKERCRLFDVSCALVAFNLFYFFIVNAFLLHDDQPWVWELSLIAAVGSGLLFFCGLHYLLVMDKDEWVDNLYHLAGPVPAIFLIVVLVAGLFGAERLLLNWHLNIVATITCILNVLGRHWLRGEGYFNLAAVVVAFLYLAALGADPLIYGYHEPRNYVGSLAKSAALNGNFAIFAIMFYAYNLHRLEVLARLDTRKLLSWSAGLVFSCWLYQNPITRAFADRIPIFKDLLPASAGLGAFFLLPIGAIVLRRYRSN